MIRIRGFQGSRVRVKNFISAIRWLKREAGKGKHPYIRGFFLRWGNIEILNSVVNRR